MLTQGRQHPAGFDHGVVARVQAGQHVAAQRRVEPARLVRVDQPHPPAPGVVAGHDLLEHGELVGSLDHEQGPVGPEPDAGRLAGQLLPELAGPQCHLELVARGPTAHPDQAEVAHRRRPGLQVARRAG